MKLSRATVLLLAFVPMLASAHKKSTRLAQPAVINQAQYVYVQAIDGDENNSNLIQEDRQAIADVEQALQKRGHCTLTGSACRARNRTPRG
jgi:hypothetical protein